jgi:hypothetical protein
MKIRMLTSICGPDVDLAPKAETESFSAAESLRLMLTDQAEPADEEAEIALADARAAVQAEEPAQEPEQAAVAEAPRADPLDHDGDGKRGGSRKGAASTRAKGARKRG